MRFSIRYKFTIGLLIIFALGFNVITFFINNIVMENNKKVIRNELLSAQRDVNIYFKQYLVINRIESSESGVVNYANSISYALSSKLNNRIVMYKSDGSFLFDTDFNQGNTYSDTGETLEDDLTDLNSAINGQSAFKIVKQNKTYKVIFSQPIYDDKNTLAIVRYTKDYTEMFNSGDELLIRIKTSLLLIFLLIFIFSYLLSTRIIVPIIKLSKATKQMSNGNFDTDILIKSNDEISELGESFNNMKKKIKEQIETIKKDRDDLIKMEGHRKVFFDNVTHEMKTPLTIIEGYSQMILDEVNANDEIVIKATSKIKKESRKLQGMIGDILDMSKLESKAKMNLNEKIDMAKLLENICDYMNIKAKKYEIFIKKDLEENSHIWGNRDEISSIFINIIDNSIKYGNVKSTIHVKLFKENNQCTIVVQDFGKGIESKELEKIFEPFYRVYKNFSAERGGNGLGLAIVKAIVNKYKGTIQIESKINEGTRVCIKIPLFLQLGNKLIT